MIWTRDVSAFHVKGINHLQLSRTENFPHREQVMHILDILFFDSLGKLLNNSQIVDNLRCQEAHEISL